MNVPKPLPFLPYDFPEPLLLEPLELAAAEDVVLQFL